MTKPNAQPPQVPRPKVQGLESVFPFAVLLAALALLAYANSFGAGFVFDNRPLILDDPRVHSWTSENLRLILRTPYWWHTADTPLYRPVTTLTYLLNYSVFGNGDRPFGYHAVNLVLHAVNVWLLFTLVWHIGRRFWPAFCTAAIWAVHPIGTEAVTNIIGRADLLAAFGVLAAFHAHLRARTTAGSARWTWRLGAAAALTVGVFSKESAAAGIAVIVLYDLLFKEPADAWRGRLSDWLVIALPVLAFLWQRSVVLGGTPAEIPFVDNPIAGTTFWTGRLTALGVMARYIGLVVWPIRLSADYSFAEIPLASGTAKEWVAWIVVAGLLAAAIVAVKKDRALFFCLTAAFVVLLPGANLLFVTGTIMAERLMYFPSAFLIAAVVSIVYSLSQRTVPFVAPVLFGAVVALGAFGTAARDSDWHDDLSLWTATVKSAPRSFKSHGSLAEALYRADPTHGNLQQVIDEKEKSLAILQGVPEPAAIATPYREAATYYLEQGEWLRDHRGSADQISRAYQHAAALGEQYLRLIARRPVSPGEESDARLIVATAYERLQEGHKAVTAARQAVADQPFNPVAYRVLASALLSAQQADAAAVELMTGFTVTGNADLRGALIAIYKGGLDERGCAISNSGGMVVLNTSCEIVRRHLCEAADRAMRLQHGARRPDLEAQAAALTASLDCGSSRTGTP